MITNWFKSIVSNLIPRTVESIGQGAQTFEKKAKAKLIDVTEGAFLTEEAIKKGLERLAVLRGEGSPLDRFRLWAGTRRKTKKELATFYGDAPEIFDEVTEKIREAASHDPFYRKLFSAR